ncbi:MAG: hypothetical protein HY902_12575 [Deltaproteobacteria bacterium]|nr:hypothetical protein [Deltaproteobacteria bacterium]
MSAEPFLHGEPLAADGNSAPSVGLWLVVSLLAAVAALWTGPGVALPPAQSDATFDLERDLSEATVVLARPAGEVPCPRSAADGRFRCGSDYWQFVGAYAGISGGRPHRCTWAHPISADATTVIRWKNQSLGQTLQAGLGLVDEAGGGAAVTMRVLAGGEELASLTSSDSRTWASVDKPLPAGRSKGELRIEIRTSNPNLRMACIDLHMVGHRPTAPRAGEQP